MRTPEQITQEILGQLDDVAQPDDLKALHERILAILSEALPNSAQQALLSGTPDVATVDAAVSALPVDLEMQLVRCSDVGDEDEFLYEAVESGPQLTAALAAAANHVSGRS